MRQGNSDMPKVRVEMPEESTPARMDVVALAMRRIEERKQATLDNKDQSLQKNIENFSQDPKSYTEWAVKYLWENRDALVKSIQQELFDKGPNTITSAALISFIMDRHVHPYIAAKLTFTVGKHWEKAELGISNSPLGLFLHHTLSSLLTDLAKDCVVWKKSTRNYDSYQVPYFLTGDPKQAVEEIATENIEYTSVYRGNQGSDYTIKSIKKVNLSQFLAIIKKRGFDFNEEHISLAQMLKKLYEVIDAYVCETDLKIDYKDEYTWLDSKTKFEKAFATVGTYIHGGIRENNDLNGSISLNDSAEIHSFIEKLICDISGLKKEPEKKNAEPSDSCWFLPKLEKLTKVREQLLVHMQRLVISSTLQPASLEMEFLAAYDQHAFVDNYYPGQTQRFAEEYKQATDWFGKNTKKAKKKALEEKPITEEIPNLYRMMEYIYKLYSTGKVYITSNDPDQQRQGEILKEVAQISADYLGKITVDLEAKLAVGDFSTEQLSEHVAQLAGLLDSRQLQTAIKSVRVIEEEIEIRRDSQLEVENLLEPLSAKAARK